MNSHMSEKFGWHKNHPDPFSNQNANIFRGVSNADIQEIL